MIRDMKSFAMAVLQELRRSWITIAVVVTAVTVWPLVLLAHLNHRIGHVWYSIAFAIGDLLFLRRVDRRLKQQLFDNLSTDYQKGLRVLEIGPGFGGNFSYYPRDFVFSTLDRNPQLRTAVTSLEDKHPNIRIEGSFIGDAENMSEIRDESFDIVIATHTLCCINDPSRAVKDMFRILRKGGKLYVFEAVAYDASETWGRLAQRLVSPFWKFLALGCKAGNIDAKSILRDAGFDVSRLVTHKNPDAPINLKDSLFGVAVKP